MADEMIKIKITIAGNDYTLNIDSSKKELYLLAERRVNTAIKKFQQKNFEGFRVQDAIALTAFEFAVSNIGLKQQSELDPEEITALKELNQKLAEYLNRP